MKKILSLILAGALILSTMLCFTACGENTATVATIDGQEISAGIYIYFLNMAYNDLYGNLTENTEVDSDYDVYAQTYEDKSASDWIIDRAIEYCAEYVAVKNESDRLSVSLASDQKNYIENMASTYWDSYGYADTFGKLGMSQASFKACLSASYLRNEIFQNVYGEGGEKAVSKDELTKFMTDNYKRVKYYGFSKSVSDSETDANAKLSAIKSNVSEMLDLINGGISFDVVIDDYEKETSSDTETEAETETEVDPYEKETMIYKDSVSPSEDFVKMVFEKTSADYGKAFMFEDDANVYIVQVLDVNERVDYVEENSDSLLSNYKFEEFDNSISEIAKTLTVEKNNSAIKRYEPKKIGVPAA